MNYSLPQKVTKHLCLKTMAEWISILFGGYQNNIDGADPQIFIIFEQNLIEKYHYNPDYTWGGGLLRYFFQVPIFLQSIELLIPTVEQFESCL